MRSLNSVRVGAFALLLVAGGSAAPARAAESSSFVGGQVGYGRANENLGGGVSYGVNGGYFFNEMWGAGAFLRASNHEEGITSTMFGLDAIYRLDPVVPGMRVAGTLATMKFSGTGYSGDYNLAIGPKAMLDFPVSTEYPITAGAEAGLLWTKPQSDTLTVFHIMGTVKLWFG